MRSSSADRHAGVPAAFRSGWSALLLRRPRADLTFAPASVFAMLVPLLLLDLAAGWFAVGGRYGGWSWERARDIARVPSAEGLIATFAALGLLLFAAWLAVLVLRRRAALWSLAAPLAAAWFGFGLVTATATLLVAFTTDDPWGWYLLLRPVYVLLWLLMCWRLLAGFARGSGRVRRGVAAVAIVTVTASGMWLHDWPDYWQPDWQQLRERMAQRDADGIDVPDFDGEAVIYAQPALLDAAWARLAPERPGRTDLYALGFAGDGHEPVFGNEVRYFAQLVAERFDAGGRTVALVNDAAHATAQPIASLTALRTSLVAIAGRMDVTEDLLLLFLTTHGSEDHELLVQLGSLPLEQIGPGDLAEALDDSGIRWRIVVVSACYSGGFVEALADARTIVMTAARADRTSFGCGIESDITWFGQALLAEAFNEQRDPVAAFHLAAERIAERERAQELEASEPQLHVGAEIAERLPAWLHALPPADTVPFRAPD